MHTKVKFILAYKTLKLRCTYACKRSNQRKFRFCEREREKLDNLETLGNGVFRWNDEELCL
jgi:hypothetical protein